MSPRPPRLAALKHLVPAWFAIVMGLAGLSLAWHRAAPVMGELAGAAAWVLGAAAALVYLALLAGSLLRARRHAGAWAEDLRHPVRHAFVAAVPIGALLLATAALAAGFDGAATLTLWRAGALGQFGVTVWVLSRWWRGTQPGGLPWAAVTPALFIPIVGNVLVPLAGVPLGQAEWSAAQFGVGVLGWPLVTALLGVRIAVQGLWPERLLPASFIFVAPPAVTGLALLQFGLPALVGWACWGMALFSLLWVAALMRRIAALPFGLAHWGMSFPLAAFTALTLRLAPTGPGALLGVALLAMSSLLVAVLVLATLRGLRDGRLLAPETVPIAAPAGAASASPGS